LFHHCVFEHTVREHPKARYPQDSGHGFRTNGSCRGLVFEDCLFRDNAGYGVQLGGQEVDLLDFVRSTISGSGLAAVTRPSRYEALMFRDCKVEGNKDDRLPTAKPFPGPPPAADFRVPDSIRTGEPVQFQCNSHSASGIAERLWDFGDGIPEVTAQPKHIFSQPGKHRVTLIVWDKNDRGGRVEKTIEVIAR